MSFAKCSLKDCFNESDFDEKVSIIGIMTDYKAAKAFGWTPEETAEIDLDKLRMIEFIDSLLSDMSERKRAISEFEAKPLKRIPIERLRNGAKRGA